MEHSFVRVRKFQVVSPYKIELVFEDDTIRLINFEQVLKGSLYGALKDPSLFAKVQLDAVAGTLVWPNGADFDPDTLYNWPGAVDQLVSQLRD